MEEEWRDVVGYEGMYMVSNLGRVKSVSRAVAKSNGRTQAVPEIIRKHEANRMGYLYVSYYAAGRREIVYTHRAVVEAFVGLIPDGMEVHHIDGDKTNNVLSNLERVDSREHKSSHTTGSGNHRAALDEQKVSVIRSMLALGQSRASIARSYGVNWSTINRISTGKAWKHVSINQ